MIKLDVVGDDGVPNIELELVSANVYVNGSLPPNRLIVTEPAF